jgi:hypothetical protein
MLLTRRIGWHGCVTFWSTYTFAQACPRPHLCPSLPTPTPLPKLAYAHAIAQACPRPHLCPSLPTPTPLPKLAYAHAFAQTCPRPRLCPSLPTPTPLPKLAHAHPCSRWTPEVSRSRSTEAKARRPRSIVRRLSHSYSPATRARSRICFGVIIRNNK